MKTPSPLHIVSTSTDLAPPDPPAYLGEAGAGLWRKMVSEYNFDDAGGQSVLAQACRHLDVAEELRKAIEEMGAVGQTEAGALRIHPAVAGEINARNSCARLIRQLGVNDKPKRDRPGRPPRSEESLSPSPVRWRR
jgi:phage terminase small subunit